MKKDKMHLSQRAIAAMTSGSGSGPPLTQGTRVRSSPAPASSATLTFELPRVHAMFAINDERKKWWWWGWL